MIHSRAQKPTSASTTQRHPQPPTAGQALADRSPTALVQAKRAALVSGNRALEKPAAMAGSAALQRAEIECSATVETDRYTKTATTTNRNTGTGWANGVIAGSVFSKNLAGVTNKYAAPRTQYSCAEPKALAEAIRALSRPSQRWINKATIKTAKVKAREMGDPASVVVGEEWDRCANCEQWAGSGKGPTDITPK